MSFQDKVVVVTGASAGLGRAQAEAFAGVGAICAVLGTNAQRTEEAVLSIRSAGGRAHGYLVDVGDEASVREVFGQVIMDHQGIDILVNNAAIAYDDIFSLMRIPEAKLRRVFDVNVLGPIFCSRAARASMAARSGGVILNISSISAYMGSGTYSVTKAALNNLTMALATELAPDRIRVVGIAPGMMDSPNSMAALPDEYRVAYRRTQLAPRNGTMADVAEAALFFCSEKAGFVTGQTMLLDGGFLLNAPKMIGGHSQAIAMKKA
jgi:3-oxoacyl-[acyl-carrier protein] reductase